MRRNRKGSYFPPDEKEPLICEKKRRVQFDEVDMLSIVWHGRYVSYLEDGRNAWGRKFAFGYNEMKENGFAAPIVQLHIDHFAPLRYDEDFTIKTICHYTQAAKINMSYEIIKEDGVLSACAYTVQSFTDFSGNPLIIPPKFVENFVNHWDELTEIK